MFLRDFVARHDVRSWPPMMKMFAFALYSGFPFSAP